ncbi:MAG: methyltransferase domain-containing protein [Pyrinomonadaceae bacterium]|nr:methyltransferase domain-containing protein [Pyrinomonadaceae bacterium]
MTEHVRPLYCQTALPIFQNRMYDSPAEGRECPKGEMYLVEQLGTGLVYNAAFDPALMSYDANYQNEQGFSSQFRAHLNAVADLVEATMGPTRLIEVGCGKGTFLQMLLARGIDVTGFDPAYEGTDPRVRKEYFSESLGISCEGLILRHVLEHIADPMAFLRRIAASNGHKGLIYIEVPCFEWICRNRAWYDIFYEHVNYFRLSDFDRMFDRVLYSAQAFGGQYLTVVADLATLRNPVRNPCDPVEFPADFTKHLTSETERSVGPTIVWGGASKGVIFALLRARAGHPVHRVIDINPAKQGRFIPGTGLQVLSPEEGLAGLPEGSTIYVMNPNYLDEIRAIAGSRFICRGVHND